MAEMQVAGSVSQRRTRSSGQLSRQRVLERAARLATVSGLEGLSVGKLAEASGMPKSSVYELFGSKEEIQLATIEAAFESFMQEVVTPALASSEPGRDRLRALCDGFLDYVERRVFPGGCFFVGASAELGGRGGRVHDRVAELQHLWRDLLLHEAEEAVRRGELPARTDPAQLVFELGTMLAGTNILSVLHDDFAVLDRARTAVRTHLGPEGSRRTRPRRTAAVTGG